MDSLELPPNKPTASSARRSFIPRLLTWWNLAVFAAWLVGPFLLAGSVRWVIGWSYLVPVALSLTIQQACVARGSPQLRRHRRESGPGTKAWDLGWNAIVWPLMACGPFVAGVGARLQVQPMSWLYWPIGMGLLAYGLAISARAMTVNPFFEGTVRVQSERDQRVIDVGPYRFVRHPGYLGLVLWAMATPFLLRSKWAFVPAVVTSIWVVVRTALEDVLLRRELAGYEEYAARVRFRLVPGVW